jgi:hypothetical protein
MVGGSSGLPSPSLIRPVTGHGRGGAGQRQGQRARLGGAAGARAGAASVAANPDVPARGAVARRRPARQRAVGVARRRLARPAMTSRR